MPTFSCINVSRWPLMTTEPNMIFWWKYTTIIVIFVLPLRHRPSFGIIFLASGILGILEGQAVYDSFSLSVRPFQVIIFTRLYDQTLQSNITSEMIKLLEYLEVLHHLPKDHVAIHLNIFKLTKRIESSAT